MSKVQLSAQAPDFELNDIEGHLFHLSDFRNEKNVLLVFNRGFM